MTLDHRGAECQAKKLGCCRQGAYIVNILLFLVYNMYYELMLSFFLSLFLQPCSQA